MLMVAHAPGEALQELPVLGPPVLRNLYGGSAERPERAHEGPSLIMGDDNDCPNTISGVPGDTSFLRSWISPCRATKMICACPGRERGLL